MKRAFAWALPLGLALSLAGCQADQEAVDDVPLERPEEIEQAPATPIPPQGIGPQVGSAPEAGDPSLSLPGTDTTQQPDTARQPGGRP